MLHQPDACQECSFNRLIRYRRHHAGPEPTLPALSSIQMCLALHWHDFSCGVTHDQPRHSTQPGVMQAKVVRTGPVEGGTVGFETNSTCAGVSGLNG